LGVGAIAEGGVIVVNDGLVAELGLRRKDLAAVIGRERHVLVDRVRRYRAGRPPIPVADRLTILVDDGLATGFTARAAIEALRRRGARKVVLAVPVAPPAIVEALRLVADEVIAVETPSGFFAIGEYYEDFSETSDDEIASLLADQHSRIAGGRGRPQEVTRHSQRQGRTGSPRVTAHSQRRRPSGCEHPFARTRQTC
jgi:predicted phosphoribosyltransferase